jgi:beta-phosphoglucomutase-like phosphatase (HAD superfamily)
LLVFGVIAVHAAKRGQRIVRAGWTGHVAGGKAEWMIEAVLFDLDGVIIDSEPVWEQVRRQVVAEHGGHWPPDAQQRLMGMSTGEWARYLSADLGVGLPPETTAALVIERMAARYRDQVPLLPGAVEAVRRLAAKWPLGLASSSPPALIQTVLDAAGLRESFAAVMSTEQVPRGKPAPDIYLAVAAQLGCLPETGSVRRPPRECR